MSFISGRYLPVTDVAPALQELAEEAELTSTILRECSPRPLRADLSLSQLAHYAVGALDSARQQRNEAAYDRDAAIDALHAIRTVLMRETELAGLAAQVLGMVDEILDKPDPNDVEDY